MKLAGFPDISAALENFKKTTVTIPAPVLTVTVLLDKSLVIQKRFFDEFMSDELTRDDFEAVVQAHNKKYNPSGDQKTTA